jgi:hypothetical protein
MRCAGIRLDTQIERQTCCDHGISSFLYIESIFFKLNLRYKNT